MIGENKLELNQETVTKAIQLYLDSQLTEKHTITEVLPVSNGYSPNQYWTYSVKFKEGTPKVEEGTPNPS